MKIRLFTILLLSTLLLPSTSTAEEADSTSSTELLEHLNEIPWEQAWDIFESFADIDDKIPVFPQLTEFLDSCSIMVWDICLKDGAIAKAQAEKLKNLCPQIANLDHPEFHRFNDVEEPIKPIRPPYPAHWPKRPQPPEPKPQKPEWSDFDPGEGASAEQRSQAKEAYHDAKKDYPAIVKAYIATAAYKQYVENVKAWNAEMQQYKEEYEAFNSSPEYQKYLEDKKKYSEIVNDPSYKRAKRWHAEFVKTCERTIDDYFNSAFGLCEEAKARIVEDYSCGINWLEWIGNHSETPEPDEPKSNTSSSSSYEDGSSSSTSSSGYSTSSSSYTTSSSGDGSEHEISYDDYSSSSSYYDYQDDTNTEASYLGSLPEDDATYTDYYSTEPHDTPEY